MTSLIELNLIPILVALLIGIVVGWTMVKRARTRRAGTQDQVRSRDAAPPVAPPPPAPPPAPATPPATAARDDEGDSLLDGEAAAVADIAGEFLGVDVHDEIAADSGPTDDRPPDNLQTLKGVGPKLAARLNDLGITRFAQLAALSQDQIEALDARLEQFRGRIARDRLVEQAGYLARGDTAGFEATFGNLGSGAR
jgi:predicted flap endonuclease-1-like 5' DNA nuclease